MRSYANRTNENTGGVFGRSRNGNDDNNDNGDTGARGSGRTNTGFSSVIYSAGGSSRWLDPTAGHAGMRQQ
jgi:hypothetical protein